MMPQFQLDFTIVLALAAASLIFLAIGVTLWQNERANDMLTEWAAENQFQIDRRERRRFFQGPFFWTTARGQYVYRITLHDAQGRQRVAWVRLGSWFLGIWRKKVQVYWEDEARG